MARVEHTPDARVLVAEFTSTEAAPLSADDVAGKVAAARQTIVDAVGIPALGTSWMVAKAQIQQTYPFAASDDFAYTDSGKMIAYQYEGGVTGRCCTTHG